MSASAIGRWLRVGTSAWACCLVLMIVQELATVLVMWGEGRRVHAHPWVGLADLSVMLQFLAVVACLCSIFPALVVQLVAERVRHGRWDRDTALLLVAVLSIIFAAYGTKRLARWYELRQLIVVAEAGKVVVNALQSGQDVQEMRAPLRGAGPFITTRARGAWKIRVTLPSHLCSYAYLAKSNVPEVGDDRVHVDGWTYHCQ
jgi:hypothetical protein